VRSRAKHLRKGTSPSCPDSSPVSDEAALVSGVVAGASAASASVNCQWQPLSLNNGWHSEQGAWNSGDPAYCIDGGYVYLSGSLAQSGISHSEYFAGLPQQARPASNLYLSVYTYASTTGVVEIAANGAMYAHGSSARQFTSLAGISWPIAALGTGQLLTPLVNNWQSADSQWGTGDPSYHINDGVVHLSGSVDQPGSSWWYMSQLPEAARPANNQMFDVYTYGGTVGMLTVHNDATGPGGGGDIGAAQGMADQFTSLAGVTYPAATSPETPLQVLNGWQSGEGHSGIISHGPSYYLSNGVVYLDGAVLNTGSGAVAVLPPEARPTHTLYLTVGTGATNNYSATLQINPDGSMYIYGIPSNVNNTPNYWTVLCGISFEAGE
jgi:hypothetical protein